MKIKKWLKYVVHNCIIHPVLPFVPRHIATKIHDSNANWAFSSDKFKELQIEKPNTEIKTFLDQMEEDRNKNLYQSRNVVKPILPEITFKPGQIICASNS